MLRAARTKNQKNQKRKRFPMRIEATNSIDRRKKAEKRVAADVAGACSRIYSEIENSPITRCRPFAEQRAAQKHEHGGTSAQKRVTIKLWHDAWRTGVPHKTRRGRGGN